MYCKNCGKELPENASVCLSCGVNVGEGNHFCQNCGEETHEQASICVKCGANLKKAVSNQVGEKSKIVAGLLAIFLGHIGIHKFYLGYSGKGILLIVLTFLAVICTISGILTILGGILFGIIWLWNIIDAIMIFTGNRKDVDGNNLK